MTDSPAWRLWIDGDACPVATEAIEIAQRHRLLVAFVANTLRAVSARPGVESIVARSGPDEADDRIVDGCAPGDVCLTSDIELAARVVLRKAGHAFSPRGDEFTPERLPSMLASRAISAHRRDQGERTSGPPAFTPQARSLFKRNFHQFLERLARRRERAQAAEPAPAPPLAPPPPAPPSTTP